MIRTLAFVLIAALISGCTVLPQRQAQRTFLLPAPEIGDVRPQGFDLTLNLALPRTQTPHGSSQILVNRDNLEIQSYSGARWSKPIPQLLQAQLIKGLRKSRLFTAVIGESSTGRTNLTFTSDLHEFELNVGESSSEVVIGLNVQLIDQQTRRILDAAEFRVTRPVDEQPIEAIIVGFGEASAQLNEAVIAWLETTIQRFYEETGQARQP